MVQVCHFTVKLLQYNGIVINFRYAFDFTVIRLPFDSSPRGVFTYSELQVSSGCPTPPDERSSCGQSELRKIPLVRQFRSVPSVLLVPHRLWFASGATSSPLRQRLIIRPLLTAFVTSTLPLSLSWFVPYIDRSRQRFRVSCHEHMPCTLFALALLTLFTSSSWYGLIFRSRSFGSSYHFRLSALDISPELVPFADPDYEFFPSTIFDKLVLIN